VIEFLPPRCVPFGARQISGLEEVLADREMSQTELARLSGVSLVTVNAMTQNRTKQFSLLTLDKICGALKCQPGDLLERKRGR
jgi:putative transcriptional regulator